MRLRTSLGTAAALAAALTLLSVGTGRAATIVSEDFEGGMPSGVEWQVLDNSAGPPKGTWDVTNHRAADGSSQSAYCCQTKVAAPGPYNHNAYGWLIYGPIDLSTANTATATFDYWLESEEGYDLLYYGYSTDDSTYSVYNHSGDSGGWKTETLDLAAEGLLGEPEVWVAWIFESDLNNVPAVDYEGAYVDNIRVEVTYAVSDDGYEENDAKNKSWDFTGGEDKLLSVYGGELGVQLDDDWYETTVATGYERLIVDCTFTHANGNIDIEIREQTGDFIGESISTTDDEHIDVIVPCFGSYYIKVYGDDGGNTYDLKWYTVLCQPDLVVTNIQPSPSNPTTAETISVTVTVKNQGDADAGPFAVALFYHPGSEPSVGDAGDESKPVSSLAAGTSTTVTFTGIGWIASDPLTWNMYAIVDNGEEVAESDEGNNVGGPATVTWSDDKPDLTVDSITVIGTPTVGQNAIVRVQVSNLSTDAEAVNFRVDLFYDRATAPSVAETGDQQQTVASLAASSSTQVDFTVTSPVLATWTTWAIVDTIQAVNEEDETNNVSLTGTSITWEGVDLEVTAVTPSATSALIGTTIDVDVTVKNNGNLLVAADAFAVGLVHDSATEPAIPVASDETPLRNVTGIAADGGTETLTFSGVTNATVGTWQMWAAADNAEEVSEYDETNNVLAAAQTVTWCAPDLRIVSVTPNPSNPTTSQTIDVEVIVENQGGWAAAEFVVGLIYDSATVPVPGALADETWTVTGGLAAGAQATHVFAGIGNLTPGTWTMYAIADNVASPGAVQESDETNNVSAGTTVVWGTDKPDLTISDIVVAPDADPAISDNVTVRVTVENTGAAAAGQFNVGLFFDAAAEPAPGGSADRTEIVSSLGVGKTTKVEFTGVTSAVVDVWQTYAIADNGLAVNEEDEGNNVFGPTAVSWHAPELVVSAISVTPNQDPDVGTTVTAIVTVTNNGDAPAEDFVVALFYDLDTPPAVGTLPDDTDTVNSLAGSGTSTALSFTGITSYESGTWDVYAIVDNGEAVPESNETNNVFGPTTVNWHGPDLIVVSVVPSDDSPLTTETITVNVTVRNTGDRLASICEVALFHNRSSAPSVGDAPDEVLATGVLAAGGGEQTLTFDNGGSGINSSIEEVWQMWAVVDNGSAVAEGSESNNVGGPVAVTWGLPLVPDLVVVSVTPKVSGVANSSPDIAETLDVEVVVANNGTADAAFFCVGLFFDESSAPTTASTPDRTIQIPLLAADSGTPVVFSGITNDVEEIWTMYVLVDSGGVITETVESNNVLGPVQVNWGAQAGIVLTSPDGGEEWEVGSAQQITWYSYGDIGSTDVTIEFSDDGGGGWSTVIASTLDDGVYDWAVPDSVSAECLVRVTTAAGAPPSDVSDACFAIVPAVGDKADLRIVSLSPSLSFAVPATDISVDVTVRNSGAIEARNFFLTLYQDRGSPPGASDVGNWSKLVDSVLPGAEVTVTFTGITHLGAPTTWRMYGYVDWGAGGGSVDESNEGNNVYGPVLVGWGQGVSVVRVQAPNGGESYERGLAYSIQWEEPSLDVGSTFNIEISTDGGATWTDIVRDVPDGTHSYDWTVDAQPSAACRVRITNSAGTVSDVSDRVFSVVAEGTGAPMLIGEGCAPVRKTHHAPARWASALLLALALVKRKRELAG